MMRGLFRFLPAAGMLLLSLPVSAQGSLLAPDGRSADPRFFPIGVWMQGTRNIAEFRTIGINVFVGFFGDLDQASLAEFARTGMPVIAAENEIGRTSPQAAARIASMVPDEPDNAQPDGHGGYRPCITPGQLVADYQRLKSIDAHRPVVINFGRGVSDTGWRGRGTCTGQTTTYYPAAVAGGDILSYDIYPVANDTGRLELVAQGVDNLKTWVSAAHASKVIWNDIEGAPISNGKVPTPAQERAEVWMSIIHGSQGIVYFVHQFSADGRQLVREDGIFNFPDLVKAVTAINAEIRALAPVLNSPTIAGNVAGPEGAPIGTMVKRYDGAAYIFAAVERDKPVTATFTLQDMQTGRAEVIGEGRNIPVTGGVFHDAFDGYGVHLYRITGR